MKSSGVPLANAGHPPGGKRQRVAMGKAWWRAGDWPPGTTSSLAVLLSFAKKRPPGGRDLSGCNCPQRCHPEVREEIPGERCSIKTLEHNPVIHLQGLGKTFCHDLTDWTLAIFHLGNVTLGNAHQGCKSPLC